MVLIPTEQAGKICLGLAVIRMLESTCSMYVFKMLAGAPPREAAK
jgi:hypothetical protein